MTKVTERFITDFERSARLLIEMFEKKHELTCESFENNEYKFVFGGTIIYRYYFYSIQDIYFDLKENKPKGLIMEWKKYIIDYCIKNNCNDFIKFNYYCMGARFECEKQPSEYKLTSDHVIYFKGKSELLKQGEVFTLADYELSSFGNNSPFHYLDDIIRLPNSIIEKV